MIGDSSGGGTRGNVAGGNELSEVGWENGASLMRVRQQLGVEQRQNLWTRQEKFPGLVAPSLAEYLLDVGSERE